RQLLTGGGGRRRRRATARELVLGGGLALRGHGRQRSGRSPGRHVCASLTAYGQASAATGGPAGSSASPHHARPARPSPAARGSGEAGEDPTIGPDPRKSGPAV